MALYKLKFVDLFNPMFMQGSNLGTKVVIGPKASMMAYDDTRGLVWVQCKGFVSSVPVGNVASMDPTELPTDIQAFFTPEPLVVAPAVAKARRGRPPLNTEEWVENNNFINNDPDEDLHRAQVRAASAAANKPNPNLVRQEDKLIQDSRNAAMGIKSAQISNPTQPAEGASVSGKPKALSHSQLRAQIAQEAKDVQP